MIQKPNILFRNFSKTTVNFLTLSILFAVAFATTTLMAQTGGEGAITGTVTDTTGAAVADATVIATNVATNVATTRTTTGTGTYIISPLPAGMYSLQVSA